jgi:hypothetical protein
LLLTYSLLYPTIKVPLPTYPICEYLSMTSPTWQIQSETQNILTPAGSRAERPENDCSGTDRARKTTIPVATPPKTDDSEADDARKMTIRVPTTPKNHASGADGAEK